MDLYSMKLKDFLEKPMECSCGRTHRVDTKTVEIGVGVLEKIPEIIKTDGYTRPFLVADRNTFEVAGKKLVAILEQANIPHAVYVFDDFELVPDERAIGSMLLEFDQNCDLMIAVGSGTLNDLVKFASFRLGLAYYIVATAASMDGYASSIAPLIRKNLKTIFEAQMPRAILADLDILAQAPQAMNAAGFGDILGKFVALADWKLAALINDEYYCDTVAKLTRHSLEKTMSLKKGVAESNHEAIGELMEALIIAGIGMSYVGNSRPASGSEHHLSHFWDMLFLLEGKKAVLHGTTVGLGTVLVAKLYQYLREEGLDSASVAERTSPNNSNWEEEVERVFSKAAPEVILLEEQEQKNNLAFWQQRRLIIAEKWPEIKTVLSLVPDHNQLADLLRFVHGVANPADCGITPQQVQDGVIYAKEVRPRYTILQLLWDLDLLKTYAKRSI